MQDGTYEFEGRSHQLPLTEPERRNAIHGLVRGAAWTAGEQEPNRVVLEHSLQPQPGYPFSVALRLEYALTDDGLSVSTTATNIGATPCPYGAGAHPYLTLGTETVDSIVLGMPGRRVLHSDERGLPVGETPVEGTEYDFRKPRAIGETKLDHAFADFERDENDRVRIELRDPGAGTRLALWMDAGYRYVMLFTGDTLADVGRRSLAVEPMTCPPNAFRTGEAVIRLEPGGSFTSTWGIAPTLPA